MCNVSKSFISCREIRLSWKTTARPAASSSAAADYFSPKPATAHHTKHVWTGRALASNAR